MPRAIDVYVQRESIIDQAKTMKPSDMFDIMGESFRTKWFKFDTPEWRLGQRFMNCLNLEQYNALTETPYDTFYVNETMKE
jgi:hypothetical protein